MTPREARTQRRAAERKAKKAEMRPNKQAGLGVPDSALNRNPDCKGGAPNPGFVSQSAAPPPLSGFVSHTSPTRAAINRANAQHSTGPRTRRREAGFVSQFLKARSRVRRGHHPWRRSRRFRSAPARPPRRAPARQHHGKPAHSGNGSILLACATRHPPPKRMLHRGRNRRKALVLIYAVSHHAPARVP